jgi:hypothetical protein
MVVGNNESTTTKNVGESLAISIAMQMWQYDAGHIARWSTSRALLEATRLELKSSGSFLAIKCCQRKKSKKVINSLPAKSCYGGFKKSVLLAKHKDTNIPTMVEPFSSSAAWF